MSMKETNYPINTGFPNKSMDNGIDQRKLRHRTSCNLNTAGDRTREYQNHAKQLEMRQNEAMILAVSISYAI